MLLLRMELKRAGHAAARLGCITRAVKINVTARRNREKGSPVQGELSWAIAHD